MHRHQLSPDSEPKAGQSEDTNKVQICEPMSSMGIIYRSVGVGLLIGSEIPQRQLHHHGADDGSPKLET